MNFLNLMHVYSLAFFRLHDRQALYWREQGCQNMHAVVQELRHYARWPQGGCTTSTTPFDYTVLFPRLITRWILILFSQVIGYNIDYDEYHRQNLKNIWAEWGRIYGLLVWGLSFFFSPFPLQSKAESERKTIVSNLNLNACNTLVSNRNESFVSKNKITTEEDD